MLIPKGFAWAIVDEKGELIEDSFIGSTAPAVLFICTTRESARTLCETALGERVVKVKIEVIK